jgi:hypothetical protein
MFVLSPDTALPVAALCRTADNLRILADDLEALAFCAQPETAVLKAAPILDDYMSALAPTPALIGRVSGHNVLPGQERVIHTSALWVVDEAHGWARTLSRYYRLGAPRGAGSCDDQGGLQS